MTGTLILLALTLVTLAVYLLAEHRDEVRAWVAREPFDLDHADGLRAPSSFCEQEPMPHGPCSRPGCRVNHRGQR